MLILILFHSYGFTLDYRNTWSSFAFRVVVSTSPKESIRSPAELLPTPEMIEDKEKMQMNTEVMKVYSNTMSESFLAYLRSILMINNYDGEDKDKLMVSCPRVPEFEFLVLDFAIELMEIFADKHFDKTTVEEDLKALEEMKPGIEQTVMMFNMTQKKTF